MNFFKNLSIKELRERAQSNAPEAGRDPWLGLTIRFFSIYITKFLIGTKITANWVTIISVFVFFSGVSLFAFNLYYLNFVGIFLIYFSIVLDGCDGEIARLRQLRSNVGGDYTEPVSHDIQYALMFLPLTWGAYIATGSIWIVYIGFIATLSKLLHRLLGTRFNHMMVFKRINENTDAIRTMHHIIPFKKKVNLIHRLYRFVNRNFFSSVGLPIPLLFFSIIKRIDLFIWSFAAFYVVVILITFFKQIVHIRKLNKNYLR